MKTFNFTSSPKICIMMGITLFGSTSLPGKCFAQDRGAVIRTNAHRSAMVSLDQLVGYYQLPNRIAFIEFQMKDTSLLARQLWDNKEYQLIRIDQTNFESKDEGHKIEFLRDSAGHFNHAKILGRIMTAKVGFDPRKSKPLSAEQLKRLEGTYTFSGDNNHKIKILSTQQGLTLKQMWDDKEVTFTPRSETFFLNEDGTFPLTFMLSNGEAIHVTCFENDIWLKDK
ncbi:hypothetical protein ACFSSD_16770 [Sphingobacterium griseoflavum]